jgi:hypothetical protein
LAKIKRVTTPKTSEAEELDHSYIPDGNVKWYSHWSVISYTTIYAITTKYDPARTLLNIYPREIKKTMLTQKPVHKYSEQFYSKYPQIGSNSDVHHQGNG